MIVAVVFIAASLALLFAIKNCPTTKPDPKPRYRGYLDSE